MSSHFRTFLLIFLGFLLGYLFFSYSNFSFPFNKAKDVQPAIVATEKQIEPNAEDSKEYISVGEKKCEIAKKHENPYKSGEFIFITQDSCASSGSESSFFLQNANGGYEQIVFGGKTYGDNTVYEAHREPNLFINADELIFVSAEGEGMGCASGFRFIYHKLNIRTKAVSVVAESGFGSRCHDPSIDIAGDYENACYDDTQSYKYKTNKLDFSVTCTGKYKTGSRTLKVLFNDKTILTKTVLDSDSAYNFSGTDTTIMLEQKSPIITFSAGKKPYSIDTLSGKIFEVQ